MEMRKPKGFTLIELLVVIAIIALLMAILMPSLSRVRRQAQSIACQARLRQWGLAFKFYTDDNNGYFNRREEKLWMTVMEPYYNKDPDMLLCPTATRLMENTADWGTFKAATLDNYIFSYGINSWVNNNAADRSGGRMVEWFWKNVQNNTTVAPGTRTPTGRVVSADRIPIFGDSTWYDAWPQHTDSPSLTPDAFGIGDKGTSGEMNHFCIDRHNGFCNLAFMDWSVRHVGLKELWTLKWNRAFDTNGAWTKAGGALPEDWPVWLRLYKDH
jgi:prepilin-type N-terminal cleavage/methylation domain-containing protein/prepilin-type processing-associated H-X9-DG protein